MLLLYYPLERGLSIHGCEDQHVSQLTGCRLAGLYMLIGYLGILINYLDYLVVAIQAADSQQNPPVESIP